MITTADAKELHDVANTLSRAGWSESAATVRRIADKIDAETRDRAHPEPGDDNIADAGKMVEPVNAGAGCDLGKYRTGETPMVGDMVRGHGQPVGHWGTDNSCPENATITEIAPEPYSASTVVTNALDRPYYAARFDLISRPAPSPGQGTEGEDKDARIAELEAEVTKMASLLLRIRGAIHHTESGYVAIHDDLPTRDTVKAIDAYLNNRPASPVESPEPVEDRSIESLEDFLTNTDIDEETEAVKERLRQQGVNVDAFCERVEAIVKESLTPHMDAVAAEFTPAAPVPAGQVVDGPGLYRTEGYDRFDTDHRREDWLVVMFSKSKTGRWIGEAGTSVGIGEWWDDGKCHNFANPYYRITGRYEPKPVTPVLTIEDHLRTLTSFVGHVGRKNIFDGGVVQAAATAVEALVAAVNEKGGV